MARLWSSGFELNTTTADVEWGTAINSPSIQSTTVRSGTYALQIPSLSSSIEKHMRYRFLATRGDGPYFIRTYFRYATLPSGDNTIISLNENQGVFADGADVAYIKLNASGALELWDEDGQVGSDSSVLSADTWYMVEMEFDRTPAAGSEVLKARLDGVEFASGSNRNFSVAVGCLVLGGNLLSELQSTGNWYFDDVAINTSTGSFQNSYPGAGSIIHLRPNAAGDNAQWDQGTGITFAVIDEVTPNDITDYLEHNDTGAPLSDFNLDATPAAIGAGDTINVVQAGVRFRVNSAGAANEQIFKVRVKATSGGTVEESGNIAPVSTTWTTNAITVPRNYPLTLYDLPGASTTPWTKADLDTAQIGVNYTVDNSTAEPDVSTLWLLVEYASTPIAETTTSKFMPFFGFGR